MPHLELPASETSRHLGTPHPKPPHQSHWAALVLSDCCASPMGFSPKLCFLNVSWRRTCNYCASCLQLNSSWPLLRGWQMAAGKAPSLLSGPWGLRNKRHLQRALCVSWPLLAWGCIWKPGPQKQSQVEVPGDPCPAGGGVGWSWGQAGGCRPGESCGSAPTSASPAWGCPAVSTGIPL